MQIDNDTKVSELQKIVFWMLRHWGNNNIDTSVFKQLSHNKDLVPKFTQNLNHLVELFSTYFNATYDIQGVRDNGVDILMNFEDNDGRKKIGFQVKSYNDIKNKDFLSKLKAQMFEADSWRLDEMYIIFCTDNTEHLDKIRNAIADITKSRSSIYIIEPEKALKFFLLNNLEISINVMNYYRSNDSIFINAKKCMADYTLDEAAAIIDIFTMFIDEPFEFFSADDLFNGSLYSKIVSKFINVPISFYDLDEEEQEKFHFDDELNNECEGFNENIWWSLYNSGFFEQINHESKFNPSADLNLYSYIVESKARLNFYNEDDFKFYIFSSLLSDKLAIANKFLLRE